MVKSSIIVRHGCRRWFGQTHFIWTFGVALQFCMYEKRPSRSVWCFKYERSKGLQRLLDRLSNTEHLLLGFLKQIV